MRPRSMEVVRRVFMMLVMAVISALLGMIYVAGPWSRDPIVGILSVLATIGLSVFAIRLAYKSELLD